MRRTPEQRAAIVAIWREIRDGLPDDVVYAADHIAHDTIMHWQETNPNTTEFMGFVDFCWLQGLVRDAILASTRLPKADT